MLKSRAKGGWLALLLVSMAACWQQSPPPTVPTAVSTQAIIGGKPDLLHPGVGALTISKRTFCTGTLIASRVVLTAAHCIDSARSRGSQSTLEYRIDVPNPQSPDGYDKTYHAVAFNLLSNHPDWNGNASRGFDIGVLILKTKVDPKVAKVVPFNATPLNAQWQGKEPLFLGYGYIQSIPSAVTPNRKYGTTIPIVRVSNNAIEHRATGKSVCHGDSGGPALFTINGQVRVIAVNSYVTAPRVPNSSPPRSSCDGSGVSYRTDIYRRYINSLLTQYGDGPATCTSDQDCDSCSTCGPKKTCEPKPFPKEASACTPCKESSSCGTNGICHRFPEGFRCLQACTTDGCCPSGTICTPLSSSSKQWHCVPKAGSCGDIKCKDSAECGPGEACKAGVCRPDLPPRGPKLCHPCRSVHDCDSPKHLCYGPKGNEQCLQPCSAGDFCPTGFSCKQLYPGASKQCAPDGGTCQIPCQLDAHCPAGFACTKGICGRKGGGDHGDTCDPTPCKAGLTCAKTLGGKRCLQACGVPRGNAGSNCDSKNQCPDGSRCFAFGSNFRVCLHACRSNTDCGDKGGGRCYQGICICRSSGECRNGYTCNTSTQSIGACAKAGLGSACPQSFECRSFSDGTFCVPQGGGVRGLGESCDSLNRCNKGLVCLGTESGPICLEECTQTQKCELGGRCTRYGRSLSVCLCSGSDCPSGRTCQPLFQGQYGICRGGQSKPGCIADAECPPNHACKEGACVALPPPEPTPEPPQPEPAPEPVQESEPVQDAAPEIATPDAAPPREVSQPEVAKPEPPIKPDVPEVKPPGGCRCSALGTGSDGKGSLPLSLVMLLLLWPLSRRRRRS